MTETNDDVVALEENAVAVLDSVDQAANILSISACLVACILFIYGRKMDASYTKNKMTVLSFIICSSDLIFHTMSMSLNLSPEKPSSDFVCESLMWGYTFSCLMSMGIVVGVNLHLQKIFLSGGVTTEGLHIRKHIVAVVIFSAIMASIPLAFRGYNWSDAEQICWFSIQSESTTALVLQWSCLYGWITLTWLSSCFTVITVLRKLITANRERSMLMRGNSLTKCSPGTPKIDLSTQPTSESIFTSRPTLAVQKIDTTKIASRLILYPITLLLCQGILIIVDSESLITGKYRFIPYLIEYIFLGGQGLLHALIFLSDLSLIQWLKVFLVQKLQSSNRA